MEIAAHFNDLNSGKYNFFGQKSMAKANATGGEKGIGLRVARAKDRAAYNAAEGFQTVTELPLMGIKDNDGKYFYPLNLKVLNSLSLTATPFSSAQFPVETICLNTHNYQALEENRVKLLLLIN